LTIIRPGPLPGCEQSAQTAIAANLRIFPPAGRDALLVPTPAGTAACSAPAVHQLTVTALGT
jgi:hypothetical protein